MDAWRGLDGLRVGEIDLWNVETRTSPGTEDWELADTQLSFLEAVWTVSELERAARRSSARMVLMPDPGVSDVEVAAQLRVEAKAWKDGSPEWESCANRVAVLETVALALRRMQ